jgi:glycosyltransferase involved in cell wall biosynthesis
LKILQLSSAQFLGGGERYLADLANALVERGHEVFAVLRPQSPLGAELRKLRADSIVSLPLRNSFDARSAQNLAAFIKQHQIDLVHAHMARDYPLAAYAATRNADTRFVITRHVLFPMHRFHKLTLSKVAAVIAVSNAVALQLRAERVVAPEKIVTIHNGVDIERLQNSLADFQRDEFLRQWQLPAETLLVGTVGELKALKGQEEFLRAAAEIARQIPTARFVVAGVDSSKTQEHRKSLKELTTELGLDQRVLFIDWMDEIAKLYRALDVFVSASRSESFGLAMAEAMACETAVIATSTEGAKEIIVDGETGLLVPIGSVAGLSSSVIKLLENPVERETIAKRGATQVRNRFSMDRMIRATEDLYRRVLNNEPA